MNFNKSISLYNYAIITLATFPLMGIKLSVYSTALWTVFSIFLLIKEKTYLFLKKRDLINIIVFSSIYISYLISFFFSEDKRFMAKYLEKSSLFLIFPLFMICNQKLIHNKTLKYSLHTFVFSNLILAIYIWIRLLSNDFLKALIQDGYYNPIIRKTFSEISNIHLPYLGLLFVFSALILVKDLLFENRKILVLFFIKVFSIFILLFSVIVFAARIALFSFFIIVIYFGYKMIKNKKQLILGVFVITILTALILLLPSSRRRIFEEQTIKMELPHKGQESYQVNFRYGIYNCVKYVLKENWLFGVGVGNVQKKLDECYNSYTYENYDDYKHNSYNSHNQYLDFWLKYGIIGLACFFVYLLWGIRNDNLLYRVFLGLFLAGFLTENLFDRQIGINFFNFFNMLFFITKQQSEKYNMIKTI